MRSLGLTVMRMVGVKRAEFGDSREPLTGL
jgi:hypothetical protein